MAKFRSSLLAVFASFLNFSLAQNSTSGISSCPTNSVFANGYNASGSITVPGFQVNNSYPASTWTWSRYVENWNSDDENGNNSPEQAIALQTSPTLNLSDPSLPYTGCVIAPAGLTINTAQAEKDNGSCNSVLTSECLSEVQTQLSQGASSLSGQIQSSINVCSELMSTLGTSSTSKCFNQWQGWVATQFLPQNFTGDAYPYYPNCTSDNPGASNATDPLLAFGDGGQSGANNFTVYDRYIRIPQPVFVAVWLKATNNASFGFSTELSQNPWSDSRIMCIPANNTTPGSRTVAEADKAALGTRMEFDLFGVLAVAAVVGLVL